MLQSGFEHSPAHFVTEIYHAHCETFADLGEGLHEAAGYFEFASDEVDGCFVAEVTELEGGVEAAVDLRRVDLRGGGFGERFRAVCPVCWYVSKGLWEKSWECFTFG